MSTYSLAEAKARLSELIDRAAVGEEVVIMRHGQPVAELRPVATPAMAVTPGKPITPEVLDRLKAHRAGLRRRDEDAGTLVSKMRDESEK